MTSLTQHTDAYKIIRFPKDIKPETVDALVELWQLGLEYNPKRHNTGR